MADYFTQLIAMSQKLERLLEKKYGAQGRGLHEKLSSVQDKISPALQKRIRYIATIRNKATHEDVEIARKEITNVRKTFRETMYELNPVSQLQKLAFRAMIFAIIILCLVICCFVIR